MDFGRLCQSRSETPLKQSEYELSRMFDILFVFAVRVWDGLEDLS